MIGQVVCSKAGRDKGYFMVVVDEDEKFLYLCDGKERPLSRPKRKNAKHLSFTNARLEKDSYVTDKAIRRSLAVLRDETAKGRNRNV